MTAAPTPTRKLLGTTDLQQLSLRGDLVTTAGEALMIAADAAAQRTALGAAASNAAQTWTAFQGITATALPAASAGTVTPVLLTGPNVRTWTVAANSEVLGIPSDAESLPIGSQFTIMIDDTGKTGITCHAYYDFGDAGAPAFPGNAKPSSISGTVYSATKALCCFRKGA